MKNLQTKLAASEKGQIDEEKARRISEEESGRLYEKHMILLLEKKDLEDK